MSVMPSISLPRRGKRGAPTTMPSLPCCIRPPPQRPACCEASPVGCVQVCGSACAVTLRAKAVRMQALMQCVPDVLPACRPR
jgi:hypothetical protein